jgi:hypothetical protein
VAQPSTKAKGASQHDRPRVTTIPACQRRAESTALGQRSHSGRRSAPIADSALIEVLYKLPSANPPSVTAHSVGRTPECRTTLCGQSWPAMADS